MASGAGPDSFPGATRVGARASVTHVSRYDVAHLPSAVPVRDVPPRRDVAMPHTSDRRRREARARITQEPARLAGEGLPLRNGSIRPSGGQQILQSVLFECFAYPREEHPWDPRVGRRLSGLLSLYGSWVSPRPDRLVIGSTVAARFCGYLLPYVLSFAPNEDPVCAGIPGLRFVDYRSWGYLLRHLPTETWVEIRDNSGWTNTGRVRQFEAELEMHARKLENGYEPAWSLATLTGAESRWSPVWRREPYTDITSGLLAAMSIFLVNPDRERFHGLGTPVLSTSRLRRPDKPQPTPSCSGVEVSGLPG
jgi:hypothetical protein